MCAIIKVVFVHSLFAEFNPDEVGVEGEGYIWRPEADDDDELEQAQDVWGKKKYQLFDADTTVQKKRFKKILSLFMSR